MINPFSNVEASQSSDVRGPPTGRLDSNLNLFLLQIFGKFRSCSKCEHSFTVGNPEKYALLQQLANEGQPMPDMRHAVRGFQAKWKSLDPSHDWKIYRVALNCATSPCR